MPMTAEARAAYANKEARRELISFLLLGTAALCVCALIIASTVAACLGGLA